MMDTIHPSASAIRSYVGAAVFLSSYRRAPRGSHEGAAMTREGSDLAHFRKRLRAARPDAADSSLRRAQTTALHALNAARIARSRARNLNRVSGDILAAGLTSEAGVSLFVVGTRQFLAAGGAKRRPKNGAKISGHDLRISATPERARRASTTSGRRRRRRRDARYIDTRIVSVAYRSSRDRASSRADAHAGPPFSTHSWRKTGDGEKTPSLTAGDMRRFTLYAASLALIALAIRPASTEAASIADLIRPIVRHAHPIARAPTTENLATQRGNFLFLRFPPPRPRSARVRSPLASDLFSPRLAHPRVTRSRVAIPSLASPLRAISRRRTPHPTLTSRSATTTRTRSRPKSSRNPRRSKTTAATPPRRARGRSPRHSSPPPRPPSASAMPRAAPRDEASLATKKPSRRLRDRTPSSPRTAPGGFCRNPPSPPPPTTARRSSPPARSSSRSRLGRHSPRRISSVWARWTARFPAAPPLRARCTSPWSSPERAARRTLPGAP